MADPARRADALTPVASVVIPTYNHAALVGEAIACVLAQTLPCEAIVVDDGSTDDTPAVLARYAGDPRVRVRRVEHAGPCEARNTGIDLAMAEFLMFLDADDLIAPRKVAEQLFELSECPEAGWCLCDVQIEDEARRRTTTASAQYDYAGKALGGWIGRQLERGNFIPIMSPLIRRSALPSWLRFRDERVPEDWYFWSELAALARVRYVPQVLATYRHGRTGRSRLPKVSRTIEPTITMPLRLNLGCGTPETRSWHPIPGMVNLDKSLGWRFEDGLDAFTTGSVAGITISHALMYLPEDAWPAFLADCARVLADGGVLRITEDDTRHPQSSRRGGWQGSEPAVTLTSPSFVWTQLMRAGLDPRLVTRDETHFADRSLCQAQHGAPPDVFFIEGVKLSGVLFAPHNDDETLFAAFTILRYRPQVVVCFASTGDYGDPGVREAETRDAMEVLGARGVEQWAGGDLVAQMLAYDDARHPGHVWAPSVDASHPDHVAVARAARQVFGDRVRAYETYRDGAKVRHGAPVPFEPIWLQHKLRALARYPSQIAHPRASQFFTWDLLEYEGEPRGD